MVQQLNGAQLHDLNHVVVERLNLLHRMQNLEALKEFHMLDRVSFDHLGQRKVGTINRINQKSVSVILDTGEHWTVSPHALRKIHDGVNPLKDMLASLLKK